MYVYRLENDLGEGPYHSSSGAWPPLLSMHLSPFAMAMLESVNMSHKQMRNLLTEEKWIFAWRSMKHMEEFCLGVNYAACGLSITMYDAVDYKEFFDGQVVFDRKTAKRI